MRTMTGAEMGEQTVIKGVSRRAPRPQYVKAIRNAYFHDHKPEGGVWTSTHTPDDEDGYLSDWHWFSMGNMPYQPGSVVYGLTVSPEARVLVIDNDQDLVEVFEKYPLVETDRDVTRRRLDFEAMAHDGWDGLTTSTGTGSLGSWDTESTVWFRWVFTGTRVITRLTPDQTDWGWAA